jgi:hypothetical protein
LSHKELAAKLDQLERKVSGHDDAIRQLVAAIRQLMAPTAAASKTGRIGFHVAELQERQIEDIGYGS